MDTVTGAAMALFDEVADLPAPEREAAIALHCAGRPQLEGIVRALLEADAASRAAIRTGGAEELLARDILAAEGSAALPEALGGFLVVSLLGAGGMGAVYEAEQTHPRRRVALKTIHPWLVSDRTRAWLREEAETLGALLHPGIPQVYAVGEEAGVLFVAMERVEGRPLLDAVGSMSIRERAEVVARLCDAVAHVHGRGLVHRDIKPANVRVTPDGQPKLLDFGLAGAVRASAGDRVVGTLAYLAPEHLAGPTPPDVRADVYAMGVLLYEVLRGDLPVVLSGASLADAREVLSRQPVRPLDQGRPELAGDLAAIVARATAREPERRYASVAELGAELGRYLAHEPVLARGGGTLYALGKLARRRTAAVLGAAIAAASLATVTGVSVVAARRAAQDAAEQSRLRIAADEEAARSRALATFMEQVFFGANPRKATGDRTLIEVTRSAAERLDRGDLAEHPAEQAELRATIAESLFNVGDAEAARAQLEAALATHREGKLPAGRIVVDILHGLSVVRRRTGDLEGSDAAMDEAIAIAEAADLKLQLPDLLHSRALILDQRGETAEAEALFQRAIALKRPLAESGEMPMELLTNSLNQLGRLRMEGGHTGDAEALFGEALRLDTEAFGEAHTEVAFDWMWMAEVALARGEPERALEYSRRSVSIDEALQEPDSDQLSQERFPLARSLLDLGQLDEAEAVIERTAADRYGGWKIERMSNRLLWTEAELRARRGQDAEALDLAERIVAKVADWKHDQHWAVGLLARGTVHALAGRKELARADLEAVRDAVSQRHGPGHDLVRRAERLLAGL